MLVETHEKNKSTYVAPILVWKESKAFELRPHLSPLDYMMGYPYVEVA